MLSLILVILMLCVLGKLLKLSVKAAWGITKVLLTLVFLPIVLVAMVIGGLIYIAVPILVIIGIATFITGSRT